MRAYLITFPGGDFQTDAPTTDAALDAFERATGLRASVVTAVSWA